MSLSLSLCSKRFLHFSQRRRANTDEKRPNKILEEAQLPDTSLETTDSDRGDQEKLSRRLTVADKVKQQVTGRKTKFKTFVRTYSRSKKSDSESGNRTEGERDSHDEGFTPGSSAPCGTGGLSEWEGNRGIITAARTEDGDSKS